MKLTATPLRGLHTVALDRRDDARGNLLRIFDAQEWRGIGGQDWRWNQAVTSYTRHANTLRGMHYQLPPHAEGKLVVPQSGAMFWVSVDVRPDNTAFGTWHGVTLSAADGTALLARPGFAHGCLSLTGDVGLLILSTETHRPEGGAGFRWDDANVAIRWPDLGGAPRLSAGHNALPSFAAFAATVAPKVAPMETVDA
jgi:dTDP-4-dehydrorhamnose 3,5-epimerase